MIIAKKILKITCIVLGVILVAAIIFVGVLTITEYKPDDSESLEVASGSTFGKMQPAQPSFHHLSATPYPS